MPGPLVSLPIDRHLGSITSALASERAVVVEAEPGAGKTTRVPYELLSQPWCRGKVLVTEPRRIAARLAATRVASERGHDLGKEVGYRVRFDEKAGPTTRLVYLTEGLLLRSLLGEGSLEGVSAIVLDEVHERSEDLDVLLALLAQRLEVDPSFKLVLMSATLDAGAFIRHFSAAHVQSEGRTFAVTVEHDKGPDERPLPIRIRSAVKRVSGDEGDVLVFLPGAAEIRAAQTALEELRDFDLFVLHGDMPLAEQTKAISPGTRRRIVLSTNVAESSVTIPGVRTVIDTGNARTARFDPWTGVTRLETTAISRARCVQRAGRAGRVAEGLAIRLYTKAEFEARPEQDTPEILRADLSAIALHLLAAGHTPRKLPWLTPPEGANWHKAETFLEALGALRGGELTDVGRAMAELPLPARLARLVVAGHAQGILEEACLAAALLSERDIVLRSRFSEGRRDVEASDSDLDARIDAVLHLREERFDKRLARDLNVDPETVRVVDRVAKTLLQSAKTACRALTSRSDQDHPLTRALLRAFFDRVAQRRAGREVVLEGGAQAILDESSAVVHAPLLLALSADAPFGSRRKAAVRIACRLEADLLLDELGDRVLPSDELVFHPDKQRVEQVSRLRYGSIILDESRGLAPPSEAAGQILLDKALEKGPRAFDPEARLESLSVRLVLIEQYLPEVEKLGLAEDALVETAVRSAASTRTSLADLAAAPLYDEFVQSLPAEVQRTLREDVPLEAVLRGGKRLSIRYEKGRQPWIESRLQDFFGMVDGPTICRGRLPLQIHFLAPNQRALQVTTDLRGFWERHYPELRRQLMRRYPKHLWPEDGSTAKPPTPGRIR